MVADKDNIFCVDFCTATHALCVRTICSTASSQVAVDVLLTHCMLLTHAQLSALVVSCKSAQLSDKSYILVHRNTLYRLAELVLLHFVMLPWHEARKIVVQLVRVHVIGRI